MSRPLTRDRTALFEQFRRSFRNTKVISLDYDKLTQSDGDIELQLFIPSVSLPLPWQQWVTKRDQLLLFVKDIENSIERLGCEYKNEGIPKINWHSNSRNGESMSNHLVKQITNVSKPGSNDSFELIL